MIQGKGIACLHIGGDEKFGAGSDAISVRKLLHGDRLDGRVVSNPEHFKSFTLPCWFSKFRMHVQTGVLIRILRYLELRIAR